MKYAFLFYTLLFFGCVSAKVPANEPQPATVFILNNDALKKNKGKIAAKDAALLPA